MSDTTLEPSDYGPDSIKVISTIEAIRRRPEMVVGAFGPERALICIGGVLRAFHLASGFSRPRARLNTSLRVRGHGAKITVALWSAGDVNAEWFALLAEAFGQLQAGYAPNGLGNGLVLANALSTNLWAAAFTPGNRIDLHGTPPGSNGGLAHLARDTGTDFHAQMAFAPEAGGEGLSADLLRGYVLSECHRYPGSRVTEFSYEQ